MATTAVAIYKGKVAFSVHVLSEDTTPAITKSSLLVYDPATQQETTVGCWTNIFGKTGGGLSITYMDFGEAGLVYSWNRAETVGPATYHLNLATGKETLVAKALADPRVWGQQAVWYDNSSDIWLTDLKTHKSVNISKHKRQQWQPAIHKNRVVWTDHRDDNSGMGGVECGDTDIYLYDLSSKKLSVVENQHPAMQNNPDAHSDLVVWTDYRNNPNPTPCGSTGFSQSDVFVRNLKTSKTQKLALDSGLKIYTRVWGNQVYFTRWADKAKTHLAVFAVTVK